MCLTAKYHSKYKFPLKQYILKRYNTHMRGVLMKDLRWQSLSKRIHNHGVCPNMLYRHLTTLNSLLNNQDLDVNMFRLRLAPIVIEI